MDDPEGFTALVEEVTADVETAEAELAVEPGVVTELHSRARTSMGKELLLVDEPRKWFLKMKAPGGDAVKTEVTTQH